MIFGRLTAGSYTSRGWRCQQGQLLLSSAWYDSCSQPVPDAVPPFPAPAGICNEGQRSRRRGSRIPAAGRHWQQQQWLIRLGTSLSPCTSSSAAVAATGEACTSTSTSTCTTAGTSAGTCTSQGVPAPVRSVRVSVKGCCGVLPHMVAMSCVGGACFGAHAWHTLGVPGQGCCIIGACHQTAGWSI